MHGTEYLIDEMYHINVPHQYTIGTNKNMLVQVNFLLVYFEISIAQVSFLRNFASPVVVVSFFYEMMKMTHKIQNTFYCKLLSFFVRNEKNAKVDLFQHLLTPEQNDLIKIYPHKISSIFFTRYVLCTVCAVTHYFWRTRCPFFTFFGYAT